ncbi:MAG: GspH/FimT family pseudopilin [Xanthomonadales bacterium]|nr:GspH/FimT family pseudopilin [Xanthomonadales bacterium]
MRAQGMTLMDLMIALSVITILSSLGLPAIGALLSNSRLHGAKNEVATHLSLARSAAITHNQAAVLCPSNDGEICSRGAWAQGWIVFVDANNNRQRNKGEALIQVKQSNDRISINTGRRNTFRFRFDGSAIGSNGTFRICDERGPEYGWAVVVSQLGRVRSRGPGLKYC